MTDTASAQLGKMLSKRELALDMLTRSYRDRALHYGLPIKRGRVTEAMRQPSSQYRRYRSYGHRRAASVRIAKGISLAGIGRTSCRSVAPGRAAIAALSSEAARRQRPDKSADRPQ